MKDTYSPKLLELITTPAITVGLLYGIATYFPQHLTIPSLNVLIVTVTILSTIRWVYLKVSFKNKKKKEV